MLLFPTHIFYGPCTHTLFHIAQWAVPFNVTRWRVLVCDLVASNRMIIEKKGINDFSTNNNRRLHLKMQARGVKHNRTLYVLRQQRKGRGVTMVSTNNNKKSPWKQVRRSDQLRYPIHNRSFIAHGRLWMPCAPASTIKDKNQGYSLSEPAGSVSLEQTVTHTNRPLWACFLPIWCIHRPMIPRLWIYTSIASVPRLWTFLLP